jgi:hypothetical protein
MEKMEGVRHTLLLALGFIVLISTLVLPSVVAQKVVSLGHRHEVKGYRIGQNVTFQCQKMGEWVPGPTCTETGEPMTFIYGVDTFASCGWHIQDSATYEFLAALVRREQNWNCRAPMVPEVPHGHDWYVPFTIPVWGVVEQDHMHIDNHLNFIFHAASGRILGAAAYPVRNRLQFGKQGSTITMHGPIKWFNGHTYLPFSSASRPGGETELNGNLFVMVCCVLTLMLSTLGFTFLYKFYLRRRIIGKMLKKD